MFEGLRAALAGHGMPGAELAIGAALALAWLVVACACFAAVYRYAVRSGLLARFSAETVS